MFLRRGGTSLRVSGIPGGHKVGFRIGFQNILLVRNPLDRTLSHFKESLDFQDIRFKDWFTSDFWDFQTKYLMKYLGCDSFESVKQFILDKEIIAIPIDKLTERMKSLGFDISHVNKARREYNPTEEEINLIRTHSGKDFNLYNFVVSLK